MHLFREERIESVAASKEDFPVPALITAVAELIALQTVRRVVVSEGSQLGVEPRNALLCAEPKPARPALLNAADRAAWQTVDLRKARKRSILPIVAVQSVEPSHPQCSGAVFVNGGEAAAVKLVEVAGFGHRRHESLRLCIESNEGAPKRP